MKKYGKLTVTAMCLALCVVLPIAFHMIPDGGSLFSPIHIPVLICGLACGPLWGLVCGIIGPVLSSFITGMPPAAYLPPMMVECATYGAATGLLLKFVRTRNLTADLYISLIGAMLLGRVVSGIAKALIFAPGTSFAVWATASFVTALPGILIQLVVLPTLIVALSRSSLIPRRYAPV